MARKKKNGPKKGGKKNQENNNDNEETNKNLVRRIIDHTHIDALVFDHVPTGPKGGRGVRTQYSLSILRERLRTIYTQWEEVEQTMRERAQDAIASEDDDGAGADWENAEDRLRHEIDRQKSNAYTPDARYRAHDARRWAEAYHEDFLYFQNVTNRNARSRMINPIKRSLAEAERQGRRYAYKLELCFGQDYTNFDWLHDLLEYYDNRGIADMNYRRGRTDRLSNWIPEEQRRFPPVLVFGDLHLWTPRRRRMACGLRPIDEADEVDEAESDEEEYEDDDDDDEVGDNRKKGHGNDGLDDGDVEMHDPVHAAPTAPAIDAARSEAVDEHGLYLDDHGENDLGPLAFELDVDAIEQERNRVDSKAKHEDDDKEVDATHNARRLRQNQHCPESRPNTSNIRVRRRNGDTAVTEDHWRKIQTAEGLFIAAKETSWDWLTSYDCLDRVDRNEMPGIVATSAIRETTDLDEDYNLVLDETDPTRSDTAAPDSAPPAGASGSGGAEPTRKGIKKRGRPDDDATANKKSAKKGKKGKKGKKKGHEIDYPYLRGEFWQAKREKPADLKVKSYPTPWAEMTDGRREWHDVHQRHSPASSVDSPPRVPIEPGCTEDMPAASEESADGFWEVVAKEALETLEPSRRRCKINPERCRAWWTHDAGQCWFAHSNKTDNPVLASDDYVAAEVEAMKIDTPDRLIMPVDGLGIYRRRLEDHYGMRPSKKSRWPKRGIRVLYEPFSFDDRKLDPEKTIRDDNTEDIADEDTGAEEPGPEDNGANGPDTTGSTKKIIASDAGKRAAFSFRSMNVPIIHEPVEDWGEVPLTPTPPPSDGCGDDEESEDEGDLFRTSYIEASRPPAATAPPGGGEDGGDLGDTGDNAIVVDDDVDDEDE